mmetsp:Transcript_21096/g.40156  ORF Transcript_21096/g.40156 Transcript_21096/m.40156 type:complete len:335 (+) Transcript_21096:140-1144(+)|eukprot:CAMPEP_0114263922 /NCGR_PEP_ID=MMETSP0058-20121206/22853_1 /TAXON_ID=36894 /ORGANISM="Pyramimonas parkeae, CCMP726" /LENGTH=334 /DNA_ID=CAMNT_0001380405 /DNA_START=70 /DNA_END=1074 /DNA_ORIENTATION=+
MDDIWQATQCESEDQLNNSQDSEFIFTQAEEPMPETTCVLYHLRMFGECANALDQRSKEMLQDWTVFTDEKVFSIGRSAEASLSFNDRAFEVKACPHDQHPIKMRVSNMHCRIECHERNARSYQGEARTFTLTDTSRYGTWVNNCKLSGSATLKDGDMIGLVLNRVQSDAFDLGFQFCLPGSKGGAIGGEIVPRQSPIAGCTSQAADIRALQSELEAVKAETEELRRTLASTERQNGKRQKTAAGETLLTDAVKSEFQQILDNMQLDQQVYQACLCRLVEKVVGATLLKIEKQGQRSVRTWKQSDVEAYLSQTERTNLRKFALKYVGSYLQRME